MTSRPPSQAYRALALRLHPDKNPDKSEKGQAAYVRVQKAYELLTDKEARAALDDLQKCGSCLCFGRSYMQCTFVPV